MPHPWPSAGTRAAVGATVTRWRLLDEVDEAAPGSLDLPAPARSEDELRAAARRAPVVYPGAAGELIGRELLALADFGHGPFDGRCLAARLTDQVLSAGCPAG